MTATPDSRASFSASVTGNVAGHLVVGIGNQIIEDADALLGPPHAVRLPYPLVNLPSAPARVFVGRDDELAQLDSAASDRSLVTYAVHGLGGMGKSELVLHYANRHRDEFGIQWWITADAPDRIEAGLAALTAAIAARAGKIGPAAVPDAAGWAVGFLATHPGWLLVLDNVEDVADLDKWFAALSGGRVVVTSRRDSDWEQLVDGCVRLDRLHTGVAADLLVARSQQKEDREAAEALAAELACLPLALTQVGAYLAQTRTSMGDYLVRLRDRPAATLGVGAAGTPAQRTVARVWDITLASIAAIDMFAIDVLWVLSCLAPDNVPRHWLSHINEEPGALDDAYGLLASYSMITLTADTVSTHRLVQTVVADTAVAVGALPAVRVGALDALRWAQPPVPDRAIEHWPQWATLVPHVRALAEGWPEDNYDTDLANLLGWTASYLFSQGAYAAAMAMQQRALSICEAVLEPDHSEISALLNGVALSLLELGRPAESVPLHRRALAISEATLPPDHPHVAVSLDNLAASLRAVGNHDESLRLRQRALAITEAVFGPDDPTFAMRLGNVATSLGSLGRYDEALSLQRRALEISAAALGPDHLDVATYLDNLAGTLVDLERAEESVPLQRRALAITEATLHPAHPDIAHRLANLGVSLCATGRAAEALPLELRALEISEAALGPDHPIVVERRENLAMTLAELESASDPAAPTTRPRRRFWHRGRA